MMVNVALVLGLLACLVTWGLAWPGPLIAAGLAWALACRVVRR